MTKQKKEKVVVIGDSMIKKTDGHLPTSSMNRKYLVKVMPFLATKTVDVFDYVKPIQRDLEPEAYVIHIGTTNLTTDKIPDEICSEVMRLIKELKTGATLIIQKLNK